MPVWIFRVSALVGCPFLMYALISQDAHSVFMGFLCGVILVCAEYFLRSLRFLSIMIGIFGALVGFILYMLIIMVTTLIVSTDGYDATTNFSSALACLSNIGPGLGINGPTGNYGMFSPHIKVTLCLVMLMGRLELYPVLVLFLPSTWKK